MPSPLKSAFYVSTSKSYDIAMTNDFRRPAITNEFSTAKFLFSFL